MSSSGRTATTQTVSHDQNAQRTLENSSSLFLRALPSGEYLLVVIDRYIRFPEVEIVRSTKATTVIPKLDKIFATHGIPSVVKSDSGPPFKSEE